MSGAGPLRYDVFLSYNSQDRPAVEEMARRLRAEFGYTPVYVRYNTGRHVSGVPPTFRTADPLGSLTGKDDQLAGKYRTYSPEFKEEAVRLVIETSRPIADVARELQITETSLGNWVRAYREKHAEEEPPLQVSERARLRELERRNRELEMELAFLKKAAAYFAREHR